ncbi:MAG: histidine phosphatase family protein [Sinomicrobium sp.]|nr:histidine phosphatase family protein [Sinomicrobium sp.]
MKKLIIVRHAKSSWDYDVSDPDRSLSERGIKDAHRTAAYLSNKIEEPDAVFSSPANRALHTCIIFLKNLHIPFRKLQITDAMYDFGGESVLTLLRSLDNAYNSVAVFGHNHALTSLCNIFGNKAVDNLPTSGVVLICFNVGDWAKIERGQTELIVFPKQLR